LIVTKIIHEDELKKQLRN